MIINKVILENIRSYLNEEISFPEGSVLLAGNIGSGKSTILMAIDFALFGIRRGELSGASLLRNGENKGKVELHFSIDGKEVKVGRSLKRTPTGVSQDAGFISINGIEKTGTAIELKQNVLDLLSYPKEALTKNDLLYRYTVYTSQEQMKQILLCDKEERLGTLRKVFGIDKYKRISENAKIVTGKVKERRRELAGITSDMESKKEAENEKRRQLKEQESLMEKILPGMELAEENVKKEKEKVTRIEKDSERAKELKKDIEICEVRIKSLELQSKRGKDELASLLSIVNQLQTERPSIKENIEKDLQEKKKELTIIEDRIEKAKEKIHELKAKKNEAEEKKSKISSLNSCPTCLQEVSHLHKSRIIEEESNKLKAISSSLEKFTKEEAGLKSQKLKLNEDIEKLREEDKKNILARAKLKELQEKESRKDILEKQAASLSKEIQDISTKKNDLTSSLKLFDSLEQEHREAKASLEEAEKKHRELSIIKAGISTKIHMLQESISGLREEIDSKQRSKNSFEQLTSLQHWVEDSFIPLMSTMEKHIMMRVHEGFGTLFGKWFSMLVDNESMSVRLDEEFTPIIEQNGYETDYIFLSGGEKTAAALAYRLALNQVINNIVSAIKTKSIIILDEPTDGFSSEQLDRMRAVLEELDMAQVILVSHEPKIESFVDKVIRFEKKEHVSRVLA